MTDISMRHTPASATDAAAEAELAAWLTLCNMPGLGGDAQRKLMQAFGLPAQVLAMGYTAWRSVLGAKADVMLKADVGAVVDAALTWAAQPGQAILTLADAAYPQALLEMPDPPSLLYVRGHVPLLNHPAVAMVGSRHATLAGVQTAKAFAHALSEAGLTVVSGLALGIDGAAHEGALLGQSKTIAVMGTGADRLYPARHRALAERIIHEGVLITEFPLGTPALPGHFPRRNRLIAGLAKGVLVVEAALNSGSLVTARLANELGREVMAIPGSIHSPLAKGCHRLIRDGAKLVETVEDVLAELGADAAPLAEGKRAQAVSGPSPEAHSTLSPAAQALLVAMGAEPVSFDALVERVSGSTQALLETLLMLEMAGWVVALPGDCYQRSRAV